MMSNTAKQRCLGESLTMIVRNETTTAG